MIDGFLCSVYKDQARFSWCHEHPPSPTSRRKLPTPAAAAAAPAEVVQQRWNGSVIVMCGIAIAMIVSDRDGNDGKMFTQWDSMFAAQS